MTSTYQNELAGSAAPNLVARRQAIADYRNKTYFRIKDASKTGACSAASRGIKERMRLECRKGFYNNSMDQQGPLSILPLDKILGSVEVARKMNDVTEEKKLQRESGVGFDGRFLSHIPKTKSRMNRAATEKGTALDSNNNRQSESCRRGYQWIWVVMDIQDEGGEEKSRSGRGLGWRE